jgi:hypothetical protein
MDFGGSFGILWRRKGFTLALLMLTLLGAAYAGIRLPLKYNASITVTLLNSKESSNTLGDGNPYLSFDPAMVDMANLLALKLTSDSNSLALQQSGYAASFQAQVLSENPENEEPFIQVSVEGDSKEAVALTLQGVAASLSAQLGLVQAGVPAKERLSLQTIAEVSTPVPSWSTKIKPVLGFLAVGLVLTFLLPQAVEGSVARRRRIRVGATVAADDQPRSVDHGGRAQPDRFRPSHAAGARSETVQQQRPDRQVDDTLRGPHVPPMRHGKAAQSITEYGASDPDGDHYSETERR